MPHEPRQQRGQSGAAALLVVVHAEGRRDLARVRPLVDAGCSEADETASTPRVRPAMAATTAELSTPPERKAPSGTSLTSWRSTASERRRHSSSRVGALAARLPAQLAVALHVDAAVAPRGADGPAGSACTPSKDVRGASVKPQRERTAAGRAGRGAASGRRPPARAFTSEPKARPLGRAAPVQRLDAERVARDVQLARAHVVQREARTCRAGARAWRRSAPAQDAVQHHLGVAVRERKRCPAPPARRAARGSCRSRR